MEQVFWLYDAEVGGRPGPGVAPWDLSSLRAGGIDVMLSLATDLFSHTGVVKAGISRTCTPFPDVLPPDPNVVALCSANLRLTFDFIHSNVEGGRTVLVHCAGGCDRTGLVLAHYLAIREGLGASDAIASLRAIRSESLSAKG